MLYDILALLPHVVVKMKKVVSMCSVRPAIKIIMATMARIADQDLVLLLEEQDPVCDQLACPCDFISLLKFFIIGGFNQ